MLKLGDKEYDVRSLNSVTYPAWMQYVIEMAKDMDRPVLRFIEKHLDGIDPDQHQCVLDAWMKRPDWDAPSDEIINDAASSKLATACLALHCLVPPPSWKEAVALVEVDEYKERIQQAVNVAANPTDDDIRAANKALRDRINSRNEEAGKEGI